MSIAVVPEWMAELDEEDRAAAPYVALIKRLAGSDKVDFDAAKLLVSEYRKMKEGTES